MSFPTTHPQRLAFTPRQWRILKLHLLFTIIPGLCLLPYLGHAVSKLGTPSTNVTQPAELENVNARAAGRGDPSIKPTNGHEVLTSYAGPENLQAALEQNRAEPLGLAAADFDEDGVPDLVTGYSHDGRGILSLRRGNVDFIYPNSPEAKQREIIGNFTTATFLSPAHVFQVPIAPDFIGTGDFDADGHWDVVVAARGKEFLSLLRGNGRGNFGVPNDIRLPGAVTTLITGEINRADGLADVVVAVDGKGGAEALVYEGPAGALKAPPESFRLPAPANSLALGQLSSAYTIDLAVAAGSELLLVYGRDRKLTLPLEEQESVRPARVEGRSFTGAVKSLVIGRFDESPWSEIAVLVAGGEVQLLSRGVAERRGRGKEPLFAEWMKRELPSPWPGAERLIVANVSTSAADDLLVLDSSDGQVRVLRARRESKSSVGTLLGMKDSQHESLSLTVGLAETVAVLPMQLDTDALTDLVMLRQNEIEPAVVLTASTARLRAGQADFAQTSKLATILDNEEWRAAASAAGVLQKSQSQFAKGGATRWTPRVKPSAKEKQSRRPLVPSCPSSSINVGQTIVGTLATTDCFLDDGSYVDFYTFTGTAGQQVSVTLNSVAFDTYLYLVAPDDSLLSSDDDSGGGTDSQIPSEGGFISLPASGAYTIYATSFDEEETGQYTLTLTAPSGGQCPATRIASGLTLNGTLATTDCTLTNAGDRTGAFVDIYTFNGFAGQQAVVAMSSNSFDTYLYLLTPGNDPLAEDDDGGGGTNSRIPPAGTIVLAANGVYTIFATSFAPQATGGYAISLGLANPPLASTVVTNTNDSGVGSLRQAILNANSNQGVDTISFQVAAPRTISPLSALPEITDPVVIDGTTQPGFAGAPLIELNGQFTPRGTPGLKITAGSSRVRGLVINRFGAADCSVALDVNLNVGSGIVLASGGNNIIEGNFIGTNLSGTIALCNSGNGVYMFNSSNNTIGGTTAAARNIISGNRLPGIAIGGEFSSGNLVQGNYVGTNVTGTADLGNQSNGMIVINGTGHVIGGTTPGGRNLISGNDSPGITLGFSDPAGILVQGNYIGTNADGNVSLPNLGGGIIVGGFFQLNGDPITATDNTIGGTSPAARNVISGNLRFPGDPNPDGGNGIEIINEGSQRNKIQGNYIGLNATGNAALPNAGSGVFITRAPNNFIGGDVRTDIQGTTNYIAANGRYGVGVGIRRLNDDNPGQFITGGDSVDIVFNVIGTDPTQTLRLGNGLDGVYVDADSVDIYVNSNVIAFNGRSGVRIPDANGILNDSDNSGRLVNLDLNFIFGNSSRAVDLGFEGITPNDPGDLDGGANLQQNFPDLASPTIALHEGPQEVGAPANAALTNVRGTLNSSPNTNFTVHWYFSDDAQCIAGQAGSRPLVFDRIANVNTDGSGNAPFTIPFNFPAGITRGIINCSATDPQGNTSEYSACFSVVAGGTPTPTPTPAPMTIQFSSAVASVSENGGSATVTVNRLGNNSGVATVDYATSDLAGLADCNALNSGKASSRCDYATAIGRLRFAAGESSKPISVLIVDDGYGEGDEQFHIILSNAVGANLGASGTATVTINDNETVNGGNPINQPGFFVREHYLDFFSREPDPSGLAFWTNEITSCGTDTACIELKRTNVSAAFFLSIEFQQTGYLVYRMYKAAYGGTPVPVRFNEFLPDTQQIGLGVVVGQTGWEQVLENNKNLFAADFVGRPRFATAHPTTRTAAEFVDTLFLNAGVIPTSAERTAAISEFGSGDTAGRARVLRWVAENPTLAQQEFNKAFVLMQYLGYLRRNPNDAPDGNFDGYNFWLAKLNQFNGNFVNAEMVKAFIVAGEYKQRFGP